MNRPIVAAAAATSSRSCCRPASATAVDGFASRHSFTLYGLAVAALALLLHRVTGEAKIVIGSQVAHREEPAAEMLAGPTVNSITLCLPVDSQASLLTFARMAADEVQEALHHQRLPFEVALASLPDGRRAPACRQSRRPSLLLGHAGSRARARQLQPALAALLLLGHAVGPQLLPDLARRRLAHVMRGRPSTSTTKRP